MISQIINKIKEYNNIIICRHIRPDGDCVGASLGLREIIKESFPEKTVKVYAKDFVENLTFYSSEDIDNLDEQEYENSLIIIVDTGSKERISNDLYTKGKEIIKIDHHPNVDPYANINYVEDNISSTCELIVKIVENSNNQLKLNSLSSKLLFMGMITDSGRFRFNPTNSDTLRRAATLLDYDIDLETLYANLYMKNYNLLKLQGEVYDKMQITKNGVAYIYVTSQMQERHKLTPNEASMVVNSLDSIRDSLIWVAFIDNTDGSIRVRLRSRFITISDIASNYNGGGHDRASGATVYNLQEMENLINDCDAKLKKYKEENTGWL